MGSPFILLLLLIMLRLEKYSEVHDTSGMRMFVVFEYFCRKETFVEPKIIFTVTRNEIFIIIGLFLFEVEAILVDSV